MPATQIIAEAGVNHNGGMDMALRLVDAAVEAGADMVKFQTFDARKLANRHAPKAAYQQRTTGTDESQFEMLQRLQLSRADHERLIAHCANRGIQFLSSAFDIDSFHLLHRDFGLRLMKLGSGELTNAPLLYAIGQSGCDLILSTGMATLAEVEEALSVLAYAMLGGRAPGRVAFSEALRDPAAWDLLRCRVTLLHCTTEYPAPMGETNLRAMDTLRAAFGLRVGFSDHTVGRVASSAAVARGAVVIEKHMTLDRTLPGPDHAASMEPVEFRELVDDIRAVEAALGTGIKQPSPNEIGNIPIARKGLVAARDLPAGHVLTIDDIAVRRPATGRSPMDFWDFVGSTLTAPCDEGDPPRAVSSHQTSPSGE
ncbi:MAG: N-acetylneuraminate synthase [Paracoccaceae bacterium]